MSNIPMEKIVVNEHEDKLVHVLWTGEETELAYNIELAGCGSSVTFLCLLLGRGRQQANMRVTVSHIAPDTTSKIVIKGALTNSSKVTIDGLVKINSGAKNTNAWLAANLLLSENATGTAVPSLEISENDVKAGHAATVGRVDDKELFYLMSRGLSKESARRVILRGFLQSTINDFPSAMIKKAEDSLAEM